MKLERLINFDTYEVNWKNVWKVHEFSMLKTCEQNPVWHKEGNAAVHTECVVNAAVKLIKENIHNFTETEKSLLITSALFHDIGKGVTTEFKKGNWHAYNHEVEGEKITRYLLWDAPVSFREEVCALVRWHMEPLRVFEGKEQLEKIVRLSKRCYLKVLIALKEADIMGSEQLQDKSIDYMKLQTIRDIALDMGCYDDKSLIPVDGDYIWNKRKGAPTCICMIGLPGSGKDTYIKRVQMIDENWKNAVVLCRDDIRVELGLCKEGEKIVAKAYDEDRVTKIFNDRMENAAKNEQTIIINNINLKKKYRDDYHQRLASKGYVFHYVYVQADTLDKNIERREGQIGEDVFKNMIMGFEWPDYTEFETFTMDIN